MGTLLLTTACGKPAPPSSSVPFQILPETDVVRAGDPLPATSPIFDGKKVRLRAVRGETIGLMVALNPLQKAPRPAIGLKLSASTTDGKRPNISRFQVGFINVNEPSSALFGPSRGKGRYPDRLIPEDIEKPSIGQQVYFDIGLAADVAPGRYSGQISIGNDTVGLELDVLPFSIKLARSSLVWVWYLAEEVARAHPDAKTFAARLAVEKRYRDLFAQHGALLATDAAPDELEARRELMLESAPFWPVRLRDPDPIVFEANARKAIEFFDSIGPIPFAIPIDEPGDDTTRSKVNANGAILRRAGAGPRTLLHAVTDWHRPIYDDASVKTVDVFISPKQLGEPIKGSAQREHRWTYNGRPPQAGNLVIDSKGGSLASWGWIAFRYQVELWHAWEGLYFTDRYNKKDGTSKPTDFEVTALTFDERRRGNPRRRDYGNGDGLLVYPGLHPSLRLKALRRGLIDRLLLAKLASCGAADTADQIARTAVPRALADAGRVALWPNNGTGWAIVRDRVLDEIIVHCPPE